MKIKRGNVECAPLGWYRPDSYPRLKQIVSDPGNLFDTYEQWVENAQQLFDKLTNQGMPVQKVMIDPDQMLAWARMQARNVDTRCRAEYAVIVYEAAKGHDH